MVSWYLMLVQFQSGTRNFVLYSYTIIFNSCFTLSHGRRMCRVRGETRAFPPVCFWKICKINWLARTQILLVIIIYKSRPKVTVMAESIKNYQHYTMYTYCTLTVLNQCIVWQWAEYSISAYQLSVNKWIHLTNVCECVLKCTVAGKL